MDSVYVPMCVAHVSSLLSNLWLLSGFLSPHNIPCPLGAVSSDNTHFPASAATSHHMLNAGPMMAKNAASFTWACSHEHLQPHCTVFTMATNVCDTQDF